MKNNPLVSVIIPTYNRAEIIQRTVKSVLNQSYKNLEVIIVDDASSDKDTEKRIADIPDARLIYKKHGVNSGGAAARNTGIDTATGEFIAFLDSDDIWHEDKVAIQIAALQASPDFMNTVCYSQLLSYPQGIPNNFEFPTLAHDASPKQGKQVDQPLSEYLFVERGQIQTSTLMLHRDLASTIRFRSDLRKHQDWDFCLRLESHNAQFLFIQKPLVIWNGDPRLDHVGKSKNFDLTERWFYESKPFFTQKAAMAFLIRYMLPRLIKEKRNRIYAQQLALNALGSKVISLKRFLRLTHAIWL